jgi:two-component system OmpR family sensor kinase
MPDATPGETPDEMSGETPGGRRWWAPSRWSLRVRLLVGLTALLAGVSIVIVAVTTFALRGYLLEQVDARLRVVERGGEPTAAQPGPPPGSLGVPLPGPSGVPAPDALFALGQGALTAEVVDGELTRAAALTASGLSLLEPTSSAGLAGVPVDGHAHTVTIDGLGDYRVLASPRPGGVVLIAGVPLDDVNATTLWMVVVAGLVAVVGTAAAGMVGAMIIGVTLRPLRRVAATASRVTALPLDRGEVALPERVPALDTDPRTEVGQVGAALNRMLGHVERALAARHASETRARQFLADASHELRTPLAAISGYAQLVRRTRDRVPDGVVPDGVSCVVPDGVSCVVPDGVSCVVPDGVSCVVPDDVAYAMGRVESESARMTSLVEDLLLLARLDSGRPLARETVDLSQLVVDAVSDAHVAAPGHRFELSLPDEPVAVVGDAARLHQVLANLLANARTHTPPGTRVVTRLVPADGDLATSDPATRGSLASVRMIVADDGPGIPPDLLPEIFERFARGDTSRSRAAGSTGLGLAIVAAIADAHQGWVKATSVPGSTVFAVGLPVVLAATGLYHVRTSNHVSRCETKIPMRILPSSSSLGAEK